MTPAMQQYKDIKAKYPDTIVFFRMGDFYETFFEDAKITASILNLALTSRDKGPNKTPMAGIPYHALENYLPKMIKAGRKVAICEQLEDPKLTKTVVKRGVVRIATPGTFVDERESNPSNNYILSLKTNNRETGISLIDLSTGEYRICLFDERNELFNYIYKTNPAEILIDQEEKTGIKKEVEKIFSSNITFLRDSYYKKSSSENERYLASEDNTLIYQSSLGLINYLEETQKTTLTHLKPPQVENLSSYMYLDQSTLSNLEILKTLRGETKGTLLNILDKTRTSLGSRLLRNFLLKPLRSKTAIEKRLDAVEYFFNNNDKVFKLQQILSEFSDIERICSKIGMRTANARDLLGLAHSINLAKEILPVIQDAKPELLKNINTIIMSTSQLNIGKEILRIINSEAPLNLKEGNLINEGINSELDKYRNAGKEGKEWIRNLQAEEIKKTHINSLKIKYNKVFGYYIEVPISQSNKVPAEYIRKQTLVNAERYMTPRLKEIEDLVLGSSVKANALEYEIFEKLRDSVIEYIRLIQAFAESIALVDVLSALALTASQNHYTRPTITDINKGFTLTIEEGRHPVIEKLIEQGTFVANDLCLNDSDQNIIIITGPNMIGKSTYMRQNALIIIMAHLGSFVPAKEATINITDRIFTRVGASDNLAAGESTFMVEMKEAANILLNATSRSFVILDEVGRGTSTHDGISIARAITEYIHENIHCPTIFATHYHELLSMENEYKGIVNYSINVKENNGEVIFLHKVTKGGTDQSYGIHVASMAGLPESVIQRAKELFHQLVGEKGREEKIQPAMFIQHTNPTLIKIEKRLKELNVNELTPVDSLNEINKLKNILNDKN